MADRKILVLGAKKEDALRAVLEFGDCFEYTYFGEDREKSADIDKNVYGHGKRMMIAEMLQKTAKELRVPYIDYIGELGAGKDPKMWWASRLSEKNIYTSKTFLHACYVRCAMKLAEEKNGIMVVFFVEKDDVRKAILINLGMMRAGRTLQDAIDSVKRISEAAVRRAWFIAFNFWFIISAKYVYGLEMGVNKKDKYALMHTFVRPELFDGKGGFRETYFGKLPEFMGKKGKHVRFIPRSLRSRQYEEILKNIKTTPGKFIVPHAFLGFTDVLSAAWESSRSVRIKNVPRFEGMDIGWLVRGDLEGDSVGGRLANDLLLPKFVRRISEMGIQVEELIYSFENQPWEKLLVMAMRREYSDARLVGYQHSTLSTMHLSYFFSKNERNAIPLPDAVITNGEHEREMLISAGYPKKIVITGGAIRYPYMMLGSTKRGKKQGEPETFRVVVACSIDRMESFELIGKAVEAFKGRAEYDVIIKCHPHLPFDEIFRNGVVELPENFSIAEEPTSELLADSDIVLYTSTTVCLEAIGAGVPIIHVMSDFTIDLNQMDSYGVEIPEAKDGNGILKQAKLIKETGAERFTEKRARWQEIFEDTFGNVTEEVYSKFVR